MSLKLNCIVAVCENLGIGKNNDLPWRLKSEMEYFTKMTTATQDKSKKNIVIMGRKTWESIPPKRKPLPDRINYVLSSSDLNLTMYRDTYSAKSLNEILNRLKEEDFLNRYESIWVIGGTKVYEAAMNSPYFYRLYLTKICKTFDCDTFFPELPKTLTEISLPEVPSEVQKENGLEYKYVVYEHLGYKEC